MRHIAIRLASPCARTLQAMTAVFSGYLGGLSIIAWIAATLGRTKTSLPAAPHTRFVILIPAHNEERTIGRTVASLAELDYPTTHFAVHVVTDHCTDDTAEIASHHGAIVVDNAGTPGKGMALQWAIDRFDDTVDAVCIVDADTVVDPRFLSVMDAHLRQGAVAIQGHYAVLDEEASPASALRAAALSVRHYLRPLARTTIGGSCGLFGNGMVFTRELLQQHRWTNHLTEDIELQLELLTEGKVVAFAPDAVVRAEMPSTLKAATSQNERWERGRLQLVRRYVPGLIRPGRGASTRQRLVSLDTAADLLLPPFSVLAVLTLAATVTGVASNSRQRRRSIRFGALAVATQAAYLLSGLMMVRAPATTYRALLGAPRLVAWKAKLWLRVLTRPATVAWTRTARNAPVSGDVG